MSALTFDPAGVRLRGNNQADDFSYSITSTPLGGTSSTVQSTLYDAVVDTTTTTGTKNNIKIQVAQSLTNPNRTLDFGSTDPTIATVDAAGNVAWAADGTCQIKIKSGGIERRYVHDAIGGGVTVSSIVNSYRSGSLGEHTTTKIANIEAGKTPMGETTGYGGSQCLFGSANLDVVNPSATWNTNFFAKNMAAGDGGASIDWSAISVFAAYFNGTTTSTVHYFPCVLVTGRHVIAAQHVHPTVGNTVVWLDNSGVCRKATVIDQWLGPNDIWLGYLDTDLSPYITPMQIMPSGWKAYLKSCDTTYGSTRGRAFAFQRTMHTPLGNWHAESRVSVSELNYLEPRSDSTYIAVSGPPLSSDGAWHSPIKGGDSSGPFMMLVNGKLVLLFCFFQGSGGYSIEGYSAQLEAAMHSLAATHGDNASYAFARSTLSGITSY